MKRTRKHEARKTAPLDALKFRVERLEAQEKYDRDQMEVYRSGLRADWASISKKLHLIVKELGFTFVQKEAELVLQREPKETLKRAYEEQAAKTPIPAIMREVRVLGEHDIDRIAKAVAKEVNRETSMFERIFGRS